jgi:hypothetical protein
MHSIPAEVAIKIAENADKFPSFWDYAQNKLKPLQVID